ncbi:MAG: hypothetical protein ACFFD8_10840 [Candidatus Thorarchaeota archaeon]
MSEEAIQHVVDNLMGCAVSLSAYNLVRDLNTKLALLQQINKEYNALVNKLESESIKEHDLDAASPIAKEKLPAAIQRRDDFGLNPEEMEKLSKMSPSRVDQIIEFLKQKRTIEILASLSFKEPESES